MPDVVTGSTEPSKPTRRFRLVPVKGGQPITLARPLYLVGRGRQADIQLPHRAVSKLHAILFACDGILMVRDLASTNGTRVNGQRIRHGILMPGDRISFASLSFRVELEPADEAAGAALERTECMVPQVEAREADDDSSPVVRVLPARRRR